LKPQTKDNFMIFKLKKKTCTLLNGVLVENLFLIFKHDYTQLFSNEMLVLYRLYYLIEST